MSANAAEAAFNEAAPAREKEFIVRMVQYWEYPVTAEDADAAEQIVNDGEQGPHKGQCHGYSIDSVVSAEKAAQYWRDEDDERAKCDCGHLLYDGHTGLWSGEPGKHPKPHPNACDERRCGCLVAVEAEAQTGGESRG